MKRYAHTYKADDSKPANDNPLPVRSFTIDELAVLKKMVRGQMVCFQDSGLCRDTWNELMHRLDRKDSCVA